MVGVDFVNEEDANGPLEQYDKIIQKMEKEFPDSKLKRIYHAGETCIAEKNNIEVALKAGTLRIGHGINILNKPELLQQMA